ncbi:MAG: glycosyltransferase, partial [Caldimonas sp.]
MIDPVSAPITAVIVTFQSAGTISRALAGALRCREAGLMETVVVDNGSTDATRDILERDAAWVRVILSGRNNGFGRGCNIGLAQVGTPYTLFLNPDAVVEPDALRSLLGFLEDRPCAGIVGPAIAEGEPGVEGILQVTGDRPTPATVVRSALPGPRPNSLARPIVP